MMLALPWGCGEAVYADLPLPAPPRAPDSRWQLPTVPDAGQDLQQAGALLPDAAGPVTPDLPAPPVQHCVDACDCLAAHCCKGGVCVKDVDDPWQPGGQVVGHKCVQGHDPTYCCDAPACRMGQLAYVQANNAQFRCFNRLTGEPDTACTRP